MFHQQTATKTQNYTRTVLCASSHNYLACSTSKLQQKHKTIHVQSCAHQATTTWHVPPANCNKNTKLYTYSLVRIKPQLPGMFHQQTATKTQNYTRTVLCASS